MTYGEELGSDTHQDSLVLTYLEGLLMHQAAAGSGAGTDKRSKAGHSGEDQNCRSSVNVLSSHQSNGPIPSNRNTSQGTGMLHLKKARLLQSSEDWHAAKRRRLSDPIVDLNGKKDPLLAGMTENVPKGKQDSTLLASLLQSFSSRLQSVALSQQIKQSLKEQGYSLNSTATLEEKNTRCYGVASHHLKALLNKNKAKEHKINSLPISSSSSQSLAQTGFPDSLEVQSGAKPAGEPISCAARLQTVATMVENRSSPAASPKPSVACSQLALLLSSEAHLQQYSREHTLKAQSASRLASERLAAMARLKDSVQNSCDGYTLSKELPSHVSGQTATTLFTSKHPVAPLQTPVGVGSCAKNTSKHRDTFQKNNIKNSPGISSSSGSSLLLHLLKSQNVQKQANHDQDESCVAFEDSSITPTTDEYSDHNHSFTDEESSNDDSSHSSCTPIDLSFKHRTNDPVAREPSSLENLTESLLQNWDPKIPADKVTEEEPESVRGSRLKPHQKVTLLQLLLGHKHEDKVDKSTDTQELQNQIHLANSSVQTGKRTPVITEVSSSNQTTPVNTPPLFKEAKSNSPINLSHQASAATYNPPSYASAFQANTVANQASDLLMDLSKNSKDVQTAIPPVSETSKNSSVFSASKLLQNLARCGLQSSKSETEQETTNRQLYDAKTDKPLGLFDRLSSPLLSSKTSALEENRGALSRHPTPSDVVLNNSEIENLLERRTVLQLLLGTSHKGKLAKKQRRMILKSETPDKRVSESHSSEAFHEQILAVKIKNEPAEGEHVPHYVAEESTKESKSARLHAVSNAEQRSVALLQPPEDIKREPLSPQNLSYPVSKSGLLSRLLRQNHDGYPLTNTSHIGHNNIEMISSRSGSPCTVPKKRKLPPTLSEPQESDFSNKHKNNPAQTVNKPDCHSATSCISSGVQQEDKHNRNERDPMSAVVLCSSTDNETSSYSKESRGFNVLKQLLLSENCVRDLSQPRNAACHAELNSADGKQKDIRNNPTSKKGEMNGPSLHTLLSDYSQQNVCIDPRTSHYPFGLASPAHSPFPEQLGSPGPRLESTQFNLVPATNEKEGPIRWVIRGIDRNDFSKDSPRLTKTNPILYYMLQKGASSSSGSRGADRTLVKSNQMESLSMRNERQVQIKQEPVHNTETKEHLYNLGTPFSHVSNKTSDQNGRGGIYGLLGNVLTIKKEPD